MDQTQTQDTPETLCADCEDPLTEASFTMDCGAVVDRDCAATHDENCDKCGPPTEDDDDELDGE